MPAPVGIISGLVWGLVGSGLSCLGAGRSPRPFGPRDDCLGGSPRPFRPRDDCLARSPTLSGPRNDRLERLPPPFGSCAYRLERSPRAFGHRDDSLRRSLRPTAPLDDRLMRSPRPSGPRDDGLRRSLRPTAPLDDRLMRSRRPSGPRPYRLERSPRPFGPRDDSTGGRASRPETRTPSSETPAPSAGEPPQGSEQRYDRAGPSDGSKKRTGERPEKWTPGLGPVPRDHLVRAVRWCRTAARAKARVPRSGTRTWTASATPHNPHAFPRPGAFRIRLARLSPSPRSRRPPGPVWADRPAPRTRGALPDHRTETEGGRV